MSNPVWRFYGRAYSFHPGELEPHLQGFVGKLAVSGYTPLSIEDYVRSIAHFGDWINRRRLFVADINEHLISLFIAHRCRCVETARPDARSPRYARRIRRFVSYLSEQSVLAPEPNQPPVAAIPLQSDFIHWLSQHRGISDRTIERHMMVLRLMIERLGRDVSKYNARRIRDEICARAKGCRPSTTKTFCTALRVYLRFLISVGKCRPGLDESVPLIPQWRLSALPRYLCVQDVERLIASCDCSKPGGIRDRAILLLLSRLGLRAGDILNLRLSDIDWHEGTLLVSGKGRREVKLPLPQDAGEALLRYLNEARPALDVERVFLCASAPLRAMQTSASVSDVVRLALRRAGISDPPTWGANLLRHSAATSMLRGGASLDAVGSLLRHRSPNTTVHYAKVDVLMLRRIVQPWPEVVSC